MMRGRSTCKWRKNFCATANWNRRCGFSRRLWKWIRRTSPCGPGWPRFMSGLGKKTEAWQIFSAAAETPARQRATRSGGRNSAAHAHAGSGQRLRFADARPQCIRRGRYGGGGRVSGESRGSRQPSRRIAHSVAGLSADRTFARSGHPGGEIALGSQRHRRNSVVRRRADRSRTVRGCSTGVSATFRSSVGGGRGKDSRKPAFPHRACAGEYAQRSKCCSIC